MRTQNPPPLKACRFDSDLGHHSIRLPSFSGLPLLREFFILCERTQHWHCESLEVFDNLSERAFEILFANFFHKGIPLNKMSFNEACRQCLKLVVRHRRFSILERSLDGIEKRGR